MHPLITIFIFILLDMILFKFTGFWGGLLILEIIIYKLFKVFGLYHKQNFLRGSFLGGVSYTKNYIGIDHNDKNQLAFIEAENIIKNFNSKDFCLIVLYYDIPFNCDEKKLHYSVGVFKKNTGNLENEKSKEIENYCVKNGYDKKELPSVISLYSNWEYCDNYTMKLGIKKHYNTLQKNLNDENFKKAFNIKNNTDIKVFIELYKPDTYINFHVPLEYTEKFLMFKREI